MAAKVRWHRGGWWVVTHHGGKRTERKIGPTSAHKRQAEEAAAKINAALDARKHGIVLPKAEEDAGSRLPAFREFASRYFVEDTAHLAETTRHDLPGYLRELVGCFGNQRLDELTVPTLRDWWNRSILQGGRSVATGRHYLSVLASVLNYAVELELLATSPVPAFREHLKRRQRTQQARAGAARHIRPIERPEDYDRLVEAASPEGLEARALVLLMLDGGLRLGEALAVRWGKIHWGIDEEDIGRRLLIDGARSRGGKLGPPKSGRSREVALSRRLRRALLELYRARFEPGPEAFVVGAIEPGNFRNREWRRMLERAGIGHRAMKDLRDTFASHLLSAGVQLGYVSVELGHADVAVTARHYARWVRAADYRPPMQLRSGEVPADLLARMAEERGGERRYTAPVRNVMGLGVAKPPKSLGWARGFEPPTSRTTRRGRESG
jgi:integrase